MKWLISILGASDKLFSPSQIGHEPLTLGFTQMVIFASLFGRLAKLIPLLSSVTLHVWHSMRVNVHSRSDLAMP